MIDFYYIISQKPFYKSQPDSFIERKRCFYFCSRDPLLIITELSQFDFGPVAMGRHFSKRNLSSPTPWRPFDDTWIVHLSQWLVSHGFASEKEAEEQPDACLPRREHRSFIPIVGHPEEKGQREAALLVMGSPASMGREQSGHRSSSFKIHVWSWMPLSQTSAGSLQSTWRPLTFLAN